MKAFQVRTQTQGLSERGFNSGGGGGSGRDKHSQRICLRLNLLLFLLLILLLLHLKSFHSHAHTLCSTLNFPFRGLFPGNQTSTHTRVEEDLLSSSGHRGLGLCDCLFKTREYFLGLRINRNSLDDLAWSGGRAIGPVAYTQLEWWWPVYVL